MGRIKEVAQTSSGVLVDIRFNELPGSLNCLCFSFSKSENVGPMLDWIAAHRKEIIQEAVVQKKEQTGPMLARIKSLAKAKAKLDW